MLLALENKVVLAVADDVTIKGMLYAQFMLSEVILKKKP